MDEEKPQNVLLLIIEDGDKMRKQELFYESENYNTYKKSRIRVIDTGFCYFRKINSKMFYNLHNFS